MLQTEATMNDDAPARRNDPASVLPSQWTDLLRAAASPERRLMAAVMIDAIRDHRAGIGARSGRARQLGHLAAHWIASTETTWPFSFENICAAFDVDAADLRRRLQRERATGARLAGVQTRRNMVLTGRSRIGTRSRQRGLESRRIGATLPATAVA